MYTEVLNSLQNEIEPGKCHCIFFSNKHMIGVHKNSVCRLKKSKAVRGPCPIVEIFLHMVIVASLMWFETSWLKNEGSLKPK